MNASYIYSNTEVEDVTTNTTKKRKLEGAAPFLANLDLSYNYSNKAFSWTNSVVLNYFSDRLFAMGMAGFVDVIERSTPKLNFVYDDSVSYGNKIEHIIAEIHKKDKN